MEKVTREQVGSYLNIGTKQSPSFKIIGVGITSYGIAYNPQVTTEKWIINKNATSSLDSYQLQGDISQKCYKGDPIFDYINGLRRSGAIGSAVETEVLDVDYFDDNKATKYDCTIAITNYMNEEAVIEYSIYYNGDPKIGTATTEDDGSATFEEDTSSL